MKKALSMNQLKENHAHSHLSEELLCVTSYLHSCLCANMFCSMPKILNYSTKEKSSEARINVLGA